MFDIQVAFDRSMHFYALQIVKRRTGFVDRRGRTVDSRTSRLGGISVKPDIGQAECLAGRGVVVPRIEPQAERFTARKQDNGLYFPVEHVVGRHLGLGVDEDSIREIVLGRIPYMDTHAVTPAAAHEIADFVDVECRSGHGGDAEFDVACRDFVDFACGPVAALDEVTLRFPGGVEPGPFGPRRVGIGVCVALYFHAVPRFGYDRDRTGNGIGVVFFQPPIGFDLGIARQGDGCCGNGNDRGFAVGGEGDCAAVEPLVGEADSCLEPADQCAAVLGHATCCTPSLLLDRNLHTVRGFEGYCARSGREVEAGDHKLF